jgi:site-specific DNA-methyltransferase (adenine-specific)
MKNSGINWTEHSLPFLKTGTAQRTNPPAVRVALSGAFEMWPVAGFQPRSEILSVSEFLATGGESTRNPAAITLADLTSPVQSLLSWFLLRDTGWFVSQPFEILHGDTREIVKLLPFPVDGVISSPPYYDQRTYGDSEQELGRENTVDGYISGLVDVFASIPLQPWASIWVNIGDKRRKDGGLLHIPERFLFAMEARGFVMIDKVVWAKEAMPVKGPPLGHGMIEPAPGRLNGSGWEPLFRFVRSKKAAWTDTCAVRVPRRNVDDIRYLPESLMECDSSVEGRNPSNVWLVPMGQTKRNHYAVFPPALVERPIAMTCPPAVTELGPSERIVEMVEYDDGQSKRRVGKYTKGDSAEMSGRQDTGRAYVPRKPMTRGWTLSDLPSRPGIVLDPFAGTGTTGEVAIKLGRRFIGIELYEQNVKMTIERCESAARTFELSLDAMTANPNFTGTTGILGSAWNAASAFTAALTILSSDLLSRQLPILVAGAWLDDFPRFAQDLPKTQRY